jgi:hypothetical protein
MADLRCIELICRMLGESFYAVIYFILAQDGIYQKKGSALFYRFLD